MSILRVALNPSSQASLQIHRTGQFRQTYGTNQDVLSLGDRLVLERCRRWTCTYFYTMLLKKPTSTSHDDH